MTTGVHIILTWISHYNSIHRVATVSEVLTIIIWHDDDNELQ